MTDNNESSDATPESTEEEGRVPKRVIGTPPPAGTQELVPADKPAQGGGYVLDEDKARIAERVAAVFFTITFVAGIAFIFFYAVWPGHVGDINRATRSNYMLGISLTLIFLGLAVGLTIWVRHLVTTPEVAQERHSLSLHGRGPQGLQPVLPGGHAGERSRPAEAAPPYAAAGRRAAGPASARTAARPRPAAGEEAAAHRVEERHPARRRRHRTAAEGDRLQLPGRHHHGPARGL